MMVTAHVDLTEGDTVAGRPDNVEVLLYADKPGDTGASLDAALAAIGRCRLIREGHVYEVTMHPAMYDAFLPPFAWTLGEDGEVWTRG
jgi:hypothetical protein